MAASGYRALNQLNAAENINADLISGGGVLLAPAMGEIGRLIGKANQAPLETMAMSGPDGWKEGQAIRDATELSTHPKDLGQHDIETI